PGPGVRGRTRNTDFYSDVSRWIRYRTSHPVGDIRLEYFQDSSRHKTTQSLEWTTMTQFLVLLIYGLSEGAILALAALGFVLIYKATGVINFAQGEFLLIGAYTFYAAFVLFQLPVVVALLIGVVVAVIVGVLVERLILRPMVGQSHISIIMVTIGLAADFNSVVQMLLGTQPRSMPNLLPTAVVTSLEGTVPASMLWVLAVAAVVLTLLTIFFQKSKHGIAMRSVADDEQAAM